MFGHDKHLQLLWKIKKLRQQHAKPNILWDTISFYETEFWKRQIKQLRMKNNKNERKLGSRNSIWILLLSLNFLLLLIFCVSKIFVLSDCVCCIATLIIIIIILLSLSFFRKHRSNDKQIIANKYWHRQSILTSPINIDIANQYWHRQSILTSPAISLCSVLY